MISSKVPKVIVEEKPPATVERKSPEYLEKVKCSNCRKYLSFFPIYSDGNLNAICGRCESEKTPIFFRNEIFEITMDTFKFPCCYNVNGCNGRFRPKDIPDHENWCEFKTIQCPALADDTVCEWEGLSHDIYEHFEQNHSKFILQDGKFEADLITNYSGKFLYAFGQDYFIVTKTTDSVKNVVMCTVTYIGSDQEVSTYYFRLTFKTPNGEKTLDMIGKIGDALEISVPTIIDSLDNPFSIVAEIDVFEKPKDDPRIHLNDANVGNINAFLNHEILEAVRCLVCSRYMLPPIYQCDAGHSICCTCSEETKQCPTCKRQFTLTQNFALAQVILHLTYPCSYPGCDFTSRAMDIRKHEETCTYRPTYCPVESSTYCDAKPIFSKIREHLISDHKGLFHENEVISFTVIEDMIYLHYLIPYYNKIFILHFTSDILNDCVQWNMQVHTPEEDKSNYQFDIDIQDLSGENRRFFLRGNCTLLEAQQKEIKHEVFLTFRQLESYLKDKRLLYNVRIIEENPSSTTA